MLTVFYLYLLTCVPGQPCDVRREEAPYYMMVQCLDQVRRIEARAKAFGTNQSARCVAAQQHLAKLDYFGDGAARELQRLQNETQAAAQRFLGR